MTDLPKQKQLRVAKTYPVDSVHYRQFEALREYFGQEFSEIFFQAAWSVVGPLGSALLGASQNEVQKQQGPHKLFALALATEALTLASGDEHGYFAEGQSYLSQDEPVAHEDFSPLVVSDDFEQDLDLSGGNVPIAGDPFG